MRVDRTAPGAWRAIPILPAWAPRRGRPTIYAPTSVPIYLAASPLIAPEPEIAEWAASELAPDRGIVEAAYALARRVHDEFSYDGNATVTETPPIEAFRSATACRISPR